MRPMLKDFKAKGLDNPEIYPEIWAVFHRLCFAQRNNQDPAGHRPN